MTTIRTRCELAFTVHAPTTFVFALLAARNPRQAVVDESLAVRPEVPFERIPYVPGGLELVRLVAEPGPLSLNYDATVTVQPHVPSTAPSAELAFADVPPEVLEYTLPSRYCPSDLLQRLAVKTFGAVDPGFTRITAICNWVYDRLDYVPGSTDTSSTAVDVLVGAAGVCRDYAHLAIALCRAVGVPAWYVSGYAVDLEPPDFHGFFEAYLDDDWYLFDATRMASVDGLVRIGVGRDAADVPFANSVGWATLDAMTVSTVDLDRAHPDDGTTASAISTA